ncbi:Atrial natriuretic peptide receptor 1 [Hypsibius exemplaris]|uniref:guanylate cyclase n=1 Tax=Hypsibius exemplaris TaxID=2072580 RepID=A0A1W0WJZ9_HYPEX|nr:Atrial natriuretic peptide receptor 1 [Hypsibius exemplaris]
MSGWPSLSQNPCTRNPGTPEFWNPGTRNPGTRNPGTPGPRDPEHRNLGTPGPRNPGTPEPRNPGTPEPQNPGTPESHVMPNNFRPVSLNPFPLENSAEWCSYMITKVSAGNVRIFAFFGRKQRTVKDPRCFHLAHHFSGSCCISLVLDEGLRAMLPYVELLSVVFLLSISNALPTNNGISIRGNKSYEYPQDPGLESVANRSDGIILDVCMFINRFSQGRLINDFDKAAAAVQLALDHLRSSLLPDNVAFNVTYTDLGAVCRDISNVVNHALQMTDEGIRCSVYIGPGCTYSVQSLYNYASFLQVPLIGLPGDGMGTQAEISEYPLLSRISVTHTNTASVILKFLDLFNYTHAFFAAETSDEFYDNMYKVSSSFILRNGKPLFQYTMRFRTLVSGDFDKMDIMSTLLNEIKVTSRVVFLLMTGDVVRKFMIAAVQAQMIGNEYVYLAVELFPSLSFGSFAWKYQEPDDKVARRGFQSLLLISIKPRINSAYTVFEEEVRRLAPRFGYTYRQRENVELFVSEYRYCSDVSRSVSSPFSMIRNAQHLFEFFQGHFFDAIWMYGSKVTQMIKTGVNLTDPGHTARMFQNISFSSPVNGLVMLDENGDRRDDYVISKFSDEIGRFEPFLDFPDSHAEGTLIGSMDWHGQPSFPPDEPLCGFRGDLIVCRVNATIWSKGQKAAAVAVPILGAVGLVFGVLITHRFLVSHSDPFWWRVFENELSENVPNNEGASQFGTAGNLLITPQVAAPQGNGARTASIHSNNLGSVDSTNAPGDTVRTALYKGTIVSLIELSEPKLRSQASIGRSLQLVRRMQNENIQTFIGIAVSDESVCIHLIGEVCQKGTLESILRLDTLELDDTLKFSLINDLIMGMTYVHSSPVASHGNLTDMSCLVDSRFVLKISGSGLGCFRSSEDLEAPFDHQTDRDFRPLLWRAPELLQTKMIPQGTPKGDVYSFAILIQQIILIKPPYGTNAESWNMSDSFIKDIVLEVKRTSLSPIRPRVPRLACPGYLHDVMNNCWSEDPNQRPTFSRVQATLRKVGGFDRRNIVDHLIRRMEQYAATLETTIAESVRGFMEEKKRSEELLYSILPRFVAQSINKGEVILPKTHTSTTIYFSHLDGWEDIIARTKSPRELTKALNAFYTVCDDIIETHDVYKVETSSDSYMIVSGLPIANGTRHVAIISSMSLELMDAVKDRSFTTSFDTSCRLRIGMNSGPCVAGVIGLKLPKYCLFGDTVNTASRMASSGEAGRIHMSDTSADILLHYPNFEIEERGERLIKGKGLMKTYWLIKCTGNSSSGRETS